LPAPGDLIVPVAVTAGKRVKGGWSDSSLPRLYRPRDVVQSLHRGETVRWSSSAWRIRRGQLTLGRGVSESKFSSGFPTTGSRIKAF
ncbi:hypothetical protein TYRP_022273, partial [Tyrophagus putrescentiae]